MAKRFTDVSIEEITAASSHKYAKNTKLVNRSCNKSLNEFLSMFYPSCDLKEIEKSELVGILKHYLLAIKKENGEFYKMNTLYSVKYALRRQILELRKIDITADPEFSEFECVFKNVLNMSKSAGNGTVEHHADIPQEECAKIVEILDDDDPQQLQWLMFFYILLYFCRRGIENLSTMLKDKFIIKKINGSDCLVNNKCEITKNHREREIMREDGGIIHETNTQKCPVKMFKKYISKLSPESEYLWQLPKRKHSDETWYHLKAGKNTIVKYMPSISEFCKLSKRFTNHCIRSTSCTIMGSQFSDIDVKSVSGHKSLSSLEIYKKVDNTKKIAISDSLSRAVDPQCGSKDVSTIEKFPEIDLDMNLDDIDWSLLEDMESNNEPSECNDSNPKRPPIFQKCKINIQNFNIHINK